MTFRILDIFKWQEIERNIATLMRNRTCNKLPIRHFYRMHHILKTDIFVQQKKPNEKNNTLCIDKKLL